ncbi:MAG: RidA family protein [Lachnospiraceae bacterium]|nr:RidA family protein [Lachnospiraceae bacterium]
MRIISTEKAPAAIGPYSQGIITGNLLYASGQIPVDPATGNVASTTIEGQTEQVCKNIGELLKAAGSDFSRVVKTTCFLSDINDFAAFNGVYAQYFTGKPARSCVAVKDIPKGVLCEIEIVAEV